MKVHTARKAQLVGAALWVLLGVPLARSESPEWRERPNVPIPLIDDVLPDVVRLRHHSGHYAVIGTNRLWNASLMRWLETMQQRIETITGLPSPFEGRLLRVVIPRDQAPGGGVAWSQGIRDRTFVQQLTVHDYEHGDVDQMDVVICGLMLNGYLADAPWRRPTPREGQPTRDRVWVAPSWLATGLARNLYPRFRAQDGATVLELWKTGRAPALRQLLDDLSDQDSTIETPSALAGFFVTWLGALPGRPATFAALFARLTAGQPVTMDWLVSILDDCENPNDVDGRWDAWIMREKRVVREPGMTTPQMVQQLREELRIQSGERAREEGTTEFVALPFDALIERRKEDWVRELAAGKAARLRVLFIGRGDDMRGVVEAYANFLQALSAGKRAGTLTELLGTAQAGMRKLEIDHGVRMPPVSAQIETNAPPAAPATFRLEDLFGGASEDAPEAPVAAPAAEATIAE